MLLEEIKGRSRGRCRVFREGKRRLLENHMARDDHTISVSIKADVTLVVKGVAKEDTQSRLGGEFIGCSGGNVRVALAAENE